MAFNQKIKVLVVDDSPVFREVLTKGLSEDPQITIIGTADEPYAAWDAIQTLKPDVMTLDIEMPTMNGIEFLERIMPKFPMPVVVVSSLENVVYRALSAGATDYVRKPESTPDGISRFIRDLTSKVKSAAMSNVSISNPIRYTPPSPVKAQPKPTAQSPISAMQSISNIASAGRKNDFVIAIGASTGGTEATSKILRELPDNLPGIVIVQHMPPVFTNMYAQRLNAECKMTVKEAGDGDSILPGKVLVAPGDAHMAVTGAKGSYKVRCYHGDKVSGHCPSVDVMFESMAKIVGKNGIGIILTGMGSDGAKGLVQMRKAGAYTIGQDEKTCVVYGMPMMAYNMGGVVKQAPLGSIAELIISASNMLLKQS